MKMKKTEIFTNVTTYLLLRGTLKTRIYRTFTQTSHINNFTAKEPTFTHRMRAVRAGTQRPVLQAEASWLTAGD